MDIYIGFDSAWTDNPKAPGAICGVGIENDQPVWFHPPQLVSAGQASRSSSSLRKRRHADRAGSADSGS